MPLQAIDNHIVESNQRGKGDYRNSGTTANSKKKMSLQPIAVQNALKSNDNFERWLGMQIEWLCKHATFNEHGKGALDQTFYILMQYQKHKEFQ
jgi:hypothetical protein